MSSNYPNGFNNGIKLRQIPLVHMNVGKVFYVNNSSVLPENGVSGSDGNDGTFLRPFATIDYAVSKCTANRGDIIYVMPGHAESIAAASAIDLDVAGISLVGLGKGTKMPTITYTNAAAEVAVGADDITIHNMKFNASVTAVLIGIDVEDGVNNCVISNCVFGVDAAGTDEFNNTIRFTNNNSDCVVEDCTIDMGIAGAAAGILLDADTARIRICNNIIRGDFSVANINGDTTLSTNVLIKGNLLENGIGGDLNAQPGIELLTGTTGTIADNYIVCNLATKAASVVADTCLLFENYYNEDISGAATGGIIGTASADD